MEEAPRPGSAPPAEGAGAGSGAGPRPRSAGASGGGGGGLRGRGTAVGAGEGPRTLGGKYRLGEELGHGGHGHVFKGVDLQGGGFVAIKQVCFRAGPDSLRNFNSCPQLPVPIPPPTPHQVPPFPPLTGRRPAREGGQDQGKPFSTGGPSAPPPQPPSWARPRTRSKAASGLTLLTRAPRPPPSPPAFLQVSLTGITPTELEAITLEIELLKNLHHRNVVQYLGSFKGQRHLYIILEFAENGSLSQIIKAHRFGPFPESLVAVYVTQVLQGLEYLHCEGVVHRDIKGANILTTKQGVVKLADFGVATRLGSLGRGAGGGSGGPVVGTPYWMAPEVIEMVGVTAASDIWSVGCLAVELLTGAPPYYDLQPMSALYRIVQDEHPPLPQGLSGAMADFLGKCFQKDPGSRSTAAELLKHPWLERSRSVLRSSLGAGGDGNLGPGGVGEREGVLNAVERVLSAPYPAVSPARPGSSGGQTGMQTPQSGARRPGLVGSPAMVAGSLGIPDVREVVSPGALASPSLAEWFQKNISAGRGGAPSGGRASASSTGSSAGGVISGGRRPWDVEGESAPGGSLGAAEGDSRSPASNRSLEELRGLTGMLSSKKREGVVLYACRQLVAHMGEHQEQKAAFVDIGGASGLIEVLSSPAARESQLAVHGALQLATCLAGDTNLARQHLPGSGIFPSVLQYVSPAWIQPIRLEAMRFVSLICRAGPEAQVVFLACLGVPMLAGALASPPRPKAGAGGSVSGRDRASDRGAGSGVGGGGQGGSLADVAKMNLEVSRLVIDSVWELVQSARGMWNSSFNIETVCRQLGDADFLNHAVFYLTLLDEPVLGAGSGGEGTPSAPEMRGGGGGVSGGSPGSSGRDSSQASGGRRVIIPRLQRSSSAKGSSARSASSGRGQSGGGPIRSNTDPLFLPAAEEPRRSSTGDAHGHLDTAGVGQQFLARPGPSSSGGEASAPPPPALPSASGGDLGGTLSPPEGSDGESALIRMAATPETYEEKIASLFLVFSCAGEGQSKRLQDAALLKQVFSALGSARPHVLCLLLTALKQVSLDPDALDSLMTAGAMPTVTRLLTAEDDLLARMRNSEALQIVGALCKLDKGRQEAAAVAGIVPHLCRFAGNPNGRPCKAPGGGSSWEWGPAVDEAEQQGSSAFEGDPELRGLAIAQLLQIAHSGRRCRAELWRHKAAGIVFGLIFERAWQVTALDALSDWITADGRVEDFVLRRQQLDAFAHLLQQGTHCVALLQPLTRCCMRSPRLCIALGSAGLPGVVLAKLHHPEAAVRLGLLRLLRALYSQAPNPKLMAARHDLPGQLAKVADGAGTDRKMVLVQKSAQHLLSAMNVNTVL